MFFIFSAFWFKIPFIEGLRIEDYRALKTAVCPV